jgi:hypothetical protein
MARGKKGEDANYLQAMMALASAAMMVRSEFGGGEGGGGGCLGG